MSNHCLEGRDPRDKCSESLSLLLVSPIGQILLNTGGQGIRLISPQLLLNQTGRIVESGDAEANRGHRAEFPAMKVCL